MSEDLEIQELRAALGEIGAPERISAVIPELHYDWSCGCRVTADADRAHRRWSRCAAHAQVTPRIRRVS